MLKRFKKIDFRQVSFFFVVLLVLTCGLIVFHNSKLEKVEYDNICHSLYSEKVWIDTCYNPYNMELNTFELLTKIEVVGLVISLGFIFLKHGKR